MNSIFKRERSKTVALITLISLVSCLGNLSQTAVNAMFTDIAATFSVTLGQMQWATTLYMLVLGIIVPLVTYLMMRFSVKQLVIGSVAFMLLGSSVALFASSHVMFVAGRVLQAISTGITMPLMSSVIMMHFPPKQQATVMGITGIAMGFAPNIGPTVGGAMVSAWGWQSFFIMLIGTGIVLLVVSCISIEPDKAGATASKLDLFSFVLSTVGFGGLLVGFSNASNYAFTDVLVWLPIILGLGGIAWFVMRQQRIDNPLINMDIFKTTSFAHGFWALNFLFASFMGITLTLPLFVENVWGGTPFQAGLSLIVSTVCALICNPLGGFLADKVGTRPVVIVASSSLVCGSISMIFISASTPFWMIAALQGIRGIGVSSLIGPLLTWSLADLPKKLIPDGSAFTATVRQAVASMGTAIMVLFITQYAGVLGFHLAFAFSAFFALFVLLIGITKVR